MSLIADALKTAQREKQRRESSNRPVNVPVLVPLRSGKRSPLMLWGSLGVLAVVAFAGTFWVYKEKFGPRREPLSNTMLTTPPVIVPVQATDPVPTSSRAQVPGEIARAPEVSPRAPQRVRSVPIARQRDSAIAVAPRDVAHADAAAIPQGRIGDSTGASDPAPRGDRVRIAIEQPGRLEARRLFAEAVQLQRANDLVRARALYDQVLALTPNDPDVLNNLGVLSSSMRDFDKAEEYLRRAVTIAPRNGGAWTNLGSVLAQQGKTKDAMVAFERVIAIDPRSQSARISLAQQYLAAGLLPQARGLLDAALTQNPSSAEAHYAMGQVLEMSGDRSGAIRSYETFIRIAPLRLSAYTERVRRHVDSLSLHP